VRATLSGTHRYSDDPANLASHGIDDLLAGFTQILAGCKDLLRPGGTVVVTARPWRQRGELVDLPGAILAAGANAGLIPAERCVALLAGLRGRRLIPRPSFFQLDNVRKARTRGEPWHLIVHEDVLVFRAPPKCPSSGKLKPAQREPKYPSPVIPGPGTWVGGEAERRRVTVLQEAPGVGGVADGGRSIDAEYCGEVQRVGVAGEGFVELAVDAQPVQGGGQSAQVPDPGGADWPGAECAVLADQQVPVGGVRPAGRAGGPATRSAAGG
jgi:hypothetical protein